MQPLSFSRGLHLQALHGFAQDKPAIHTLGDLKAYLIVDGVQLVQALQGTALPIRQPVICLLYTSDAADEL